MVTTFKWLRVKKTVLVSMGKNVRFSTILVFKITILLGGGGWGRRQTNIEAYHPLKQLEELQRAVDL